MLQSSDKVPITYLNERFHFSLLFFLLCFIFTTMIREPYKGLEWDRYDILYIISGLTLIWIWFESYKAYFRGRMSAYLRGQEVRQTVPDRLVARMPEVAYAYVTKERTVALPFIPRMNAVCLVLKSGVRRMIWILDVRQDPIETVVERLKRGFEAQGHPLNFRELPQSEADR